MLNHNSIVESLKENLLNKYVFISVGSVLAVFGVSRIYLKLKRDAKRRSYPRDVVIVHQFPRCLHLPSLSPFSLKLETWLRMADIKHQNEFTRTFGPKGKLPYITYNGEDLTDSDFIIEFLSTKNKKSLSAVHSARDQGIARAFSKMTEESLVWLVSLQRYVYEPNPKLTGIPSVIYRFFGGRIKSRSKMQGYGLHSKEDVYSIGRKDLKSLNDFLEDKKYLLGDKPCNEDASIFAMICQFIYSEKGPTHHFIKNECPNILAYVENMKSVYWPDWDQCIRYRKN